MTEIDVTSESEVDYPKGVTDEASCLDYLKKKEVFLYKMMNDPSHKAMLYFLEVLMNSEVPLTVEELAARFSHKTFSPEMREACGGGSPEGLREFLKRYPSLFNVGVNGHVNSVTIELPEIDGLPDGLSDIDCWSTEPVSSKNQSSALNTKEINHSKDFRKVNQIPSVSSLSLRSNASSSSGSHHFNNRGRKTSLTNGSSTDATSNATSLGHGQVSSHYCSTCPPNQSCCAKLPLAHVQTYPCVHCPLVGLTCVHHLSSCSGDHHCHHAATTHCICMNSKPSCVSTCHQCPALQALENHSKSKDSSATVRALPTLERLTLETEAVRFFQQRLLRKEERWIQIRSLAGHLSQASAEIRAVVGPQLEFRNFLLRHPHVFEIQGELVSVRDPFGALYPTRKDNGFHNSHSSSNLLSQGNTTKSGFVRHTRQHRPKSLVLPIDKSALFNPSSRAHTQTMDLAEVYKERSFHGTSCINLSDMTPTVSHTPTGSNAAEVELLQESSRSQCLSDFKLTHASTDNSLFDNAASQARNTNSLSVYMSANEYRSVMFVRKILEKNADSSDQVGLPFDEILQLLLEKAPEAIRSTIGWTKAEVEEFLSQHHLFFEISVQQDSKSVAKQSSNGIDSEEATRTMVRNKRLEKVVNIVITETKHTDTNVRSLTNHCGRIYHVTKLWGIIDLGKHEHVFFDKSIFKHIDDLQKHFKVDEILYFNAILAPKESRAKWRATEVWKECDKRTMEKMKWRLKNSDSEPTNAFHNTCTLSARTNNTQTVDISRQDSSGLDFEFEEYDDEDTDADGEIEEIDVRSVSLTEHHMTRASTDSEPIESHLHYIALAREEQMGGQPIVSTVESQEQVKLVSDVNSVDGRSNQVRWMNNGTGQILTTDIPKRGQQKQSLRRGKQGRDPNIIEDDSKNQFVSSSTGNTPSECPSALYAGQHVGDCSTRNDVTASISSNESFNNSIAVQTLSTGDIMATNLYHDQNTELCSSEC